MKAKHCVVLHHTYVLLSLQDHKYSKHPTSSHRLVFSTNRTLALFTNNPPRRYNNSPLVPLLSTIQILLPEIKPVDL